MCVSEALQWFDYQLKGKPYPHRLGVVDTYHVRAGRWKEFTGDIVPKHEKKLYFTRGGGLSESAEVLPGSLGYVYDPADPVPTTCGNALGTDGQNGGLGPKVQHPTGERVDILSFTSEPLTEPADIAGAIRARLFVSSDAPATAFTVCVSEVLADGTAYNIRDDITDIRFRSETEYLPYTPGETVRLDIVMPDIVWRLSQGSRIRVDISSSNFPMYHMHSNTTEPWAGETNPVPARQKLFFGENTPSCIVLPLM